MLTCCFHTIQNLYNMCYESTLSCLLDNQDYDGIIFITEQTRHRIWVEKVSVDLTWKVELLNKRQYMTLMSKRVKERVEKAGNIPTVVPIQTRSAHAFLPRHVCLSSVPSG